MILYRNRDFHTWKSIVAKQIEVGYELDLDIFEDVYDLESAYKEGKSSRLVVEELMLIIS